MNPKQPAGPPMTLGNMRENGHTPSLGATAQHEIT